MTAILIIICVENLREATTAENGQNQKKRKNNKSGHTGVDWDKRNKKWRVRIKTNWIEKHIGLFDDYEVACIEQEKAKAKYHTFQPTLRDENGLAPMEICEFTRTTTS